MLRRATPVDTPVILDIAVAAGMFAPDEVEPVRQVLDDVHAGGLGPDHRIEVWVDDAAGLPVGVVYYCPNVMTDRTWDLLMIAVIPERHGQGIGRELVRNAEAQVRSCEGRMLVIDTSSLPKYDRTRAFYRKEGYQEVARIPDYYRDGDSKVTYLKRLLEVEVAVADD